VSPVDPLFLEPNARYYREASDGGAILVADRAFPVEYYRDETVGATHLRKFKDKKELDNIKKTKEQDAEKQTLAVGVIHLKVARFPLGFVVGRKGDGDIGPVDEYSKQRWEIRQSRRGMSFVRAGREVETVDTFPRSSKDLSSGLGAQSWVWERPFSVGKAKKTSPRRQNGR
jgi:hypothetical protein